jgi:hypothetical protein
MSGIVTILHSGLPAGVAVGVSVGLLLIRLAHRVICVIELRMILRSLPQDDRVTAAVAYVAAYHSRAAVDPASHRRRPELPPAGDAASSGA